MSTKSAGEATAPASLSELAQAESSCRRCPLYEFATQVVPGEGAIGARLMLVGEQPGDREDLKGKPFVGPAGRVLDEALEAAGIARDETFVTNAVKHFKHEERGKRRLHKRPNAYEVERCRWWLDNERRLVKPRVIVALGVTAAQSLLGKSVTISRLRGQPQRLADGVPAVVTIHPSLLLRLRDEGEKRAEFARLVADLRQAREASR
jgi:uracil-DNA glycosylase